MLEVIATQLSHVRAVQNSGAGRIELCSAMGADGLTPSAGLMEQAIALSQLPIMVMIRPREGDFVYSSDEIATMQSDILFAKQCGAAGVVLGVLNNDQTVNTAALKELVQSAYPMDVTFHRAFDVCIEPQQALEDIIACGCTRILSSGQEKNCVEGKSMLLKMVEWADDSITIMPGAGINPNTISDIHHPAFREYHMSGLRSFKPEGKQSEFFGGQYQSDLDKIRSTADYIAQNTISE
jgi:copper homeostasis protein